MKRVYLLIAVLLVVVSIGKSVLFPAPTTASLRTSLESAVPAATSNGQLTLDRPSKLTTASLPRELGSSNPGSSDNAANAEVSSKTSEILPGLIVSARRAAIRATDSGPISELPVSEGSSVTAGQLVAHIDDCEIVAELEKQTACIAAAQARATEAQARLELAQYNHRLNQKLAQKQLVQEAAVVESEFLAKAETAKLAAMQEDVAVAQRQKAVLEQRLAKYRTVAPFSGRVTEILCYRDQYVGQGDVVVWIESHEKQLKLHLPAELIEKCGGVLERLQVSVLLQEDEWVDLKVQMSPKDSYNPDGSRTVLLEIDPQSRLLAGQIIQTRVTPPEVKSSKVTPSKITLQGEKS